MKEVGLQRLQSLPAYNSRTFRGASDEYSDKTSGCQGLEKERLIIEEHRKIEDSENSVSAIVMRHTCHYTFVYAQG